MIKKLLTITVLLFSQLLFSAPSHALKTLEHCEKEEQTIQKLSRCLDTVIEAIDRELKIWVNNHTFNLEEKALITGRHSTLNMFKRSQSNFITFRANNCRWQYLVISPGKDAANVYKKCYILLSKSRIKELSQVP